MPKYLERAALALGGLVFAPACAFAGITVPEPATYGVLGAGIAAVALVKFLPRK